MSDNPKKVEEQMEKAFFISSDCWLSVFDLLSPFQLGLGIALISHRFDRFVDEHFKTRRWSLGFIEIGSKVGKNGKKEMEIAKYQNYTWISLPIPRNPLPNKVIGFERITINYIDRNVITFLNLFRYAFRNLNFEILAKSNRILGFIVRNIWPLLKENICGVKLSSALGFRRLRRFAPSFLCDCPSLRLFCSFVNVFPAFPPDDSANALDGQAVAKWLFSPRPDGLPKVLRCGIAKYSQFGSMLNGIKEAFSSASSRVNFFISIFCTCNPEVEEFDLANEFTGEQLIMKEISDSTYLLIRCPIVRDEKKWNKWEITAFTDIYSFGSLWNNIFLSFDEDAICDE